MVRKKTSLMTCKGMCRSVAIATAVALALPNFNYVYASTLNPNTATTATAAAAATAATADSGSTTFKFHNDNYTYSYGITKLDDETVQLNTITTNTTTNIKEEHTSVYNPKKNYLMLDGKKIELTTKKTSKTQLASKNIIPDVISNWTPVYVGSSEIDFSDMVGTVSAVATIVGGIISAGALLGVAVAQTSLAAAIGNWASVAGLATWAGSGVVNGGVYFDEYRTYGQVNDGGSGTQYAYCYENLGVEFYLLNDYFDQIFETTGSWFFTSNPF